MGGDNSKLYPEVTSESISVLYAALNKNLLLCFLPFPSYHSLQMTLQKGIGIALQEIKLGAFSYRRKNYLENSLNNSSNNENFTPILCHLDFINAHIM